jgi:hypothetical protein
MSRISSRSKSTSYGRVTHSLVWRLLAPEVANYAQRNDMLSSSSPTTLPTWLSTSASNEMHGACHHKLWFHRFNHSENANSSTDESGRKKGSQQPSSTTSMGSTGSNNTLSSLNECREEPMLGPEDPVPTYWETWSHGLNACSILTTKEPDLPQVESNLNESPQEYLVVTVECIEV